MGSIVSFICCPSFLPTNTGFWAPSNLFLFSTLLSSISTFFEVAFGTWGTNTNNHFLDAPSTHHCLRCPISINPHTNKHISCYAPHEYDESSKILHRKNHQNFQPTGMTVIFLPKMNTQKEVDIHFFWGGGIKEGEILVSCDY